MYIYCHLMNSKLQEDKQSNTIMWPRLFNANKNMYVIDKNTDERSFVQIENSNPNTPAVYEIKIYWYWITVTHSIKIIGEQSFYWIAVLQSLQILVFSVRHILNTFENYIKVDRYIYQAPTRVNTESIPLKGPGWGSGRGGGTNSLNLHRKVTTNKPSTPPPPRSRQSKSFG